MNDSSGQSWDVEFGADEVRELWGGDLGPVPAELIAPDVTPATRRFLTEVGLPTVEVYGIEFVHDDRLSTTTRRARRELLVVTAVGESGLNFGIDVPSDQVFHFDRGLADYLGFFNSNIASMVFFLGLLRTRIRSLGDVDEDVLQEAIDEVRAVMRDRDPAAMADRDTGWHEILDEENVT